MIAVPFFEKALYELAEADVTPARVQALADEVETRIQGGLTARPLLAVPHILSDESSAYYHGYVLAEMSVYQTRAHFMAKYGSIVDNERVGRDLEDVYWAPGNGENFRDLVQRMTGQPLSADAWVADLEVSLEQALAEEKAAYDAARAAGPKFAAGTAVDLDVRCALTALDAASRAIFECLGSVDAIEVIISFFFWLNISDACHARARRRGGGRQRAGRPGRGMRNRPQVARRARLMETESLPLVLVDHVFIIRLASNHA